MIDVDGGHQPDRSDAARAPWNPCYAGQRQTQNLSLMEAVRLQSALRLLSVETRRIRLGPPVSDIRGSELRIRRWPFRQYRYCPYREAAIPTEATTSSTGSAIIVLLLLVAPVASEWLGPRQTPYRCGLRLPGSGWELRPTFLFRLADECGANRQPRICLGRPSRSPILPVGGTGRCDANCNRPASIASPYLPNSSITRR